MDEEKVKAIAQRMALIVLEDFGRTLKHELAAGAQVTPEFINYAIKSMYKEYYQ